MNSVLVSGATGFLGGAVARDLRRRGLEVTGLGRNPAAGAELSRDGVEFVRHCLVSGPPLDDLIARCDAVVHCAALSAPWGSREQFLQANHQATQRLLEACERSQQPKRLIHISSPSVQFAFSDRPLAKEERAWVQPGANFYIETKRLAELAALDSARAGHEVIVLRPKALFGPGDTTLLPRVVRVARRGSFPLFGRGDPLLDLTFIEDAVNAVWLTLIAPKSHAGRVFNITSGDPQPRSLVLSTMLAACGLPVRFKRVPLGLAMGMAGVLEGASQLFTRGRWEPPVTRYSVGALAYEQTLDISAAKAALGYHPGGHVIERLRATGEQWRATQERQR